MKTLMMTAIIILIAATQTSAQQNNSAPSQPELISDLNRPKISPPIPVETFAGDKGLVFQMIINKPFTPKSKFGFFNVTNFVGDYAKDNQQNQFLSQSFVTVQVWKGLSLNAGASLNYMTGFRPSAGFQYVFVQQNLLAVVLPRIDLTQSNNFEIFTLVEYRPTLKNEWGLYTRFQSLINQNIQQGFHDRSYVWLRIGGAYKNFQFGCGINIDYYGPSKINENSIGIFFRTELF